MMSEQRRAEAGRGGEEGGGGGGEERRRGALSLQNEDPTPQDGWEKATQKQKQKQRKNCSHPSVAG